MHISKILELLHTAHQRFSSINVEWTYRHHVKTLREMLNGDSNSSSSQRIFDGTSSEEEQEWGHTWSQIWWQKSALFREESGKSKLLSSTLILNQGRSSMSYPQTKGLFKKATPVGSNSFFISERDSSISTEEYAYRYAFVYPSFLIASHDFQFVDLIDHVEG